MSRLPFELLLALRYLRPKRTFVSVITLISVLGVMLGVAVLIIVISVFSGFDKELRDKVLGFTAHLRVTTPDRNLRDYAALMSLVASNENVRGVAPVVMGKVLVRTEPASGPRLADAPWLRGVDPEAEASVSDLPKSVVDGKFDLSDHGLVVGCEFAHNLRLQVGDRVAVYSQKELEKMEETKGEHVALPEDYTVHGIFDAGYYEYNVGVIVTSLENAQSLYGLDENDEVHALLVSLYDPFKATKVAEQLMNALGPPYEVTTWMQESSMMTAVLVEKNVMLYILFFIVIVAAFGITCTLITFIVMKTRDIGLMKAIGASNQQVMWVFLSQSLLVSVLGVALGLGLGLVALGYRNEFLEFMRRVTGFELFPRSVYGFNELPALIVPWDIMIICGGSLLICLLAAAFPARHASRMNPVEALRYE